MNRPPHDIRLRIGNFLVELTSHRIIGEQGSVRIEPKPMQVLACLAEHPGQTVTRAYLLQAIWPGVYVDDNALRRSISQLRKAFGDNPRHPHYIETIPRVGYRLIAPVAQETASRRPPPPSLRPTPGETKRAAQAALPPALALPLNAPRHILPVALAVMLLLAVVITGGYMLSHPRITQLNASNGGAGGSLMELPGQELYPAFSPDGRHVAFSWKPEGHDNADLYVKEGDSGNLVRLTTHAASELMPTWTADGRQIVFLRYGEGEDCGIFLVAQTGGPQHRLANCGAGQHGYSVSPRDPWIAISEKATPEAPYALVLLSTETQERHPLTPPPSPYHDVFPVFSPDGHYIAFLRSQAPTLSDLYVMRSDGSDLQRITFDNRNILGLSWTPDGQNLLFSSNRTGPYALWQISRQGGTPTLHTSAETYAPAHPTISDDGQRLAYVACHVETNIWRVPITTDAGFWQGLIGPVPESAPVISSEKKDYHPASSPDGHRMAFVSNRSGHTEIWTSTLHNPNPTKLTQLEGGYATTPRWSPDGTWLVFSLSQAGKTNLFLIDAEGETLQPLTDTSTQNVLPSWSTDGQRIYFASNRNGSWEIWMVSAAGGSATQITEAGGYHAHEVEHAGTTYLYYTKRGEAGLWRRVLNSNSEQRVLDQPAPNDEFNWVPSPQGIYFAHRDGAESALAFFEAATQQITVFKTKLPGLSSYNGGLSVSKDGRWVYYARDERKASDIILTTFSP